MGHHVHHWFLKQQARYCYRQALVQVRKGNLGVALETLPNALDHHPYPADIHVELGKTHWQQGSTEAALSHFTQAIQADPTNVKAYGNRGLLYYQRGETEKALTDWNQALKHQPDHVLIHFNRGLLYFHQQNYPAALADFDRAIANDPNLAEAYLHRGNVHEQLGDWAGAAHDWELALCNDLNLTQARLKLNQLQKAYQDYNLSQRLQAGLGLEPLEIKAQHLEDEINIEVYRPLGVGINYFTLPDQVRALLLTWQLSEVRKFKLTARVKAQDVVEWQGSYGLFQGKPCPPARWQMVLLMAFVIFPPLGIPALVYAVNLRQAYQRGDYLTALRASKIIQSLCRTGGIISLTLATLVVGYGGYQRLQDSSPPALEPLSRPEQPLPPESDG
ncbi:MAG: tetratricopeptide repeat protein [Leptolyngbyaceae cyanobacterium SM2_3_12]|nr:tetratricopeptide repeat protein [Leptolyngbyaceae cyanobacterium SM2_3_12]